MSRERIDWGFLDREAFIESHRTWTSYGRVSTMNESSRHWMYKECCFYVKRVFTWPQIWSNISESVGNFSVIFETIALVIFCWFIYTYIVSICHESLSKEMGVYWMKWNKWYLKGDNLLVGLQQRVHSRKEIEKHPRTFFKLLILGPLNLRRSSLFIIILPKAVYDLSRLSRRSVKQFIIFGKKTCIHVHISWLVGTIHA